MKHASARPQRASFLQSSPLDFEESLQSAGRLRGFHLFVGAAWSQEKIHFSLSQALVGLAHSFDHCRESGAGRGSEAVTESGQIAGRVEESGKTVRRRKGHEGGRQTLADDAHLLGI